MVADHFVRAGSTRGPGPHTGRWRRPLVVAASFTAVVAFLGWIAVLVFTLPTRYLASHWNLAWVGFDVMLLISLLTTGWAVATRRPWVGTAMMVNAAMLICDAWFDVTTASGAAATLVSLGLAAGVELPAAAGLAWAATHRPDRRPARRSGHTRVHLRTSTRKAHTTGGKNGPL